MNHKTIPQRKFGFREGNGNIEQAHRLITKIHGDLEK